MRKNPTKLGLKNLRSGSRAGWKSTMTVAEYEVKYGVRLADPDDRPTVRGRSDIISMLIKAIGTEVQEWVVIVTLDTGNKPIEIYRVGEGTLNSAPVHSREVFTLAIADRAAAIIFAHNHPGGNATPSDAGRATTARLKDAGEIVGIKLLDSLVITRHGAVSLLYGG